MTFTKCRGPEEECHGQPSTMIFAMKKQCREPRVIDSSVTFWFARKLYNRSWCSQFCHAKLDRSSPSPPTRDVPVSSRMTPHGKRHVNHWHHHRHDVFRMSPTIIRYNCFMMSYVPFSYVTIVETKLFSSPIASTLTHWSIKIWHV
jgi:hypothetical protein